MDRNDQAARLGPYAQELVENAYVQENLRDGVEKLQAAYRRARKRRVEPTRDERLRRQVRSAAQSITEAGRALRSGRRKPERRWGPRLAVIAGLGVAAAAAALWARERLGDQPSAPQPAASPSMEGAEVAPKPAA
jgi:hypothetical protein